MRRIWLGTSVEGRRIEAFVRGHEARPTVLVLGGVHGDEPKGVYVARRLIELLDADSDAAATVRWVIVPIVNPDGYERRMRRNANRVDINRNFPTRDWARLARRSRMFGGTTSGSEPETRAVIKAVTRYRPVRIVSIHSIDGHRHCVNLDGPAGVIARRMSRLNGYPVTKVMGYATPGSFGTWAGTEREIPTITLELPSHHSPKQCWEENRAALAACAKPS